MRSGNKVPAKDERFKELLDRLEKKEDPQS